MGTDLLRTIFSADVGMDLTEESSEDPVRFTWRKGDRIVPCVFVHFL
jgi:hypothetical protein